MSVSRSSGDNMRRAPRRTDHPEKCLVPVRTVTCKQNTKLKSCKSRESSSFLLTGMIMVSASGMRCSSLLFLLLQAAGAAQFSSNVVELTPRNWRTEVEESPLAVFVNICRRG